MQDRFLQPIRFKPGNNTNEVLPYFTKSTYNAHLLDDLAHLPGDCITDALFRLEEPGLVSVIESKDVGAHIH